MNIFKDGLALALEAFLAGCRAQEKGYGLCRHEFVVSTPNRSRLSFVWTVDQPSDEKKPRPTYVTGGHLGEWGERLSEGDCSYLTIVTLASLTELESTPSSYESALGQIINCYPDSRGEAIEENASALFWAVKAAREQVAAITKVGWTLLKDIELSVVFLQKAHPNPSWSTTPESQTEEKMALAIQATNEAFEKLSSHDDCTKMSFWLEMAQGCLGSSLVSLHRGRVASLVSFVSMQLKAQ